MSQNAFALVDDLQDDDLFPLSLVVPTLKKCAEMLPWITKCPGSALIHLMTIEMLPVYFFYFSVLTLMKSIVAATTKKVDVDNATLPAGTKLEVIEECLTTKANHLVWQFSKEMLIDKCLHGEPEEEKDLDTMNYPFPAMNMAMLSLCCVFVAFWLGKLLISGGLTWPCASSRYLKFIYTVRRSKPFRYIGYIFVCSSVLFIILSLMAAHFAEMLVWVLQNLLPTGIVVLAALRTFAFPTKPKFDYMKEAFVDIGFKRGSFFGTSSGFATKLSSALIQSSRGHNLPLQDLLIKPEEWKTVRDMLIESKSEKSSAPLSDQIDSIVPGAEVATKANEAWGS